MKPTFVRRATRADAETVAERLRPEDRAECLAASGAEPTLVLPLMIDEGREVYAAGIEELGRAEILYGIDPVFGASDVGVPWMLSTPVVFAYPVETAIACKKVFAEFHERYEVLTNFIDERNKRHIKFLKWLGFKFTRRVETFGAENRPFLEFVSLR